MSDRIEPRADQLVTALRALEAHHVRLNGRRGRWEGDSTTLRIIRAVLQPVAPGAGLLMDTCSACAKLAPIRFTVVWIMTSGGRLHLCRDCERSVRTLCATHTPLRLACEMPRAPLPELKG